MAKTKTPEPKKTDEAKDQETKDKKSSDGGWRETVESIAMAVILALLFRGFVAEAFVIPTGSMAPTLQGRHKDVQCPKCSFWYQTSASDERTSMGKPTGIHVVSTTCPICRYPQNLDLFGVPNHGSFSGDRIIVGKFNYDFSEPKRWDVIVFKYPLNATENYIKRLIGLPEEKVQINGGNIYTCGLNEPESELRIARKPPHKLDTLLQLVDDTDYIPQAFTDVKWPLRWQERLSGSAKGAWQAENDGRAFICAGGHKHDARLWYRHLVPSAGDWQTIEATKALPSGVSERRGQLISDFYAYNADDWIGPYYPPTSSLERDKFDPDQYDPTYRGPARGPDPAWLGQHWVDDLAVECLAEVNSDTGELLLDLVRAGERFHCRIDVATGKATLGIVDREGQPVEFIGDDGATANAPTAQTRVKGKGKYRLRLSNCDHEVLLWVNGRVVKFDGPTTYDSAPLVDPAWSANDPGDLEPAAIGSRGASLRVRSLRIYRDKYYIATSAHGDVNDYMTSVHFQNAPLGMPEAEQIQIIMGDPRLWAISNMFGPDSRRYEQFELEKDQFLPMGDNSPQSYDGRFWLDTIDDEGIRTTVPHHYVQRELLIGKALVIYWPHTWNRPIPFTPNPSKMGRIR